MPLSNPGVDFDIDTTGGLRNRQGIGGDVGASGDNLTTQDGDGITTEAGDQITTE